MKTRTRNVIAKQTATETVRQNRNNGTGKKENGKKQM